MSFSTITGLILSLLVFIGALVTATENYTVFLDPHAFLIVIGGTIGASLVSFSFSRMKILTRVFFKKVLARERDFDVVSKELIDLATGYRNDDNYLKTKLATLSHPFTKEAVSLMMEGGIEPQDMDALLAKRVANTFKRFEEDAENFKALAKFPPAFGLMGAVIGMVSLMQNLGGADAFSKVGPALAIALVATLYGIAVANFVFLPLAENLMRQNRRERFLRLMICDALRLIRQKKHPYLVEETCMSYVAPGDRKSAAA